MNQYPSKEADEKGKIAMKTNEFPSEVKLARDEIAEKLDEIADLGEYWKKHREKGCKPDAIRVAMLLLIDNIAILVNREIFDNQDNSYSKKEK